MPLVTLSFLELMLLAAVVVSWHFHCREQIRLESLPSSGQTPADNCRRIWRA